MLVFLFCCFETWWTNFLCMEDQFFCYATLERTFLPASTKMSKLFLVNRDTEFFWKVFTSWDSTKCFGFWEVFLDSETRLHWMVFKDYFFNKLAFICMMYCVNQLPPKT